MAPFFPLYIRRSDGKLETTSKGVKELNRPSGDQLDNTPNAQGISDFYRECVVGDKDIDWRRKLGGMLIRELGGKEARDKHYILAAFPENYRLYEHVKCKFSDIDGRAQKITKNHAAGANERQDAYLYGNPGGRRRRYRSPAEFFPHLLWLATDEAGDQNNCSCKFCSPEELEAEEAPPPPKSTLKEVKGEAVVKQNTPVPVLERRTSQQSAQIAQGQAPEATPLPRHKTLEQKIDAQFNEFLYRPGELVWFAHGQAWGLGVVVHRDISHTFSGRQFQYQVQPLSHPFRHPPSTLCQQNTLRPWLAWSPPPCTCAALNPSSINQNKTITYDTVNWQAFLEGSYGPGDAEVDGSILTAKFIDTTYSLFERFDSKTSTSGSSQISEIYYNGMYLGCEKFWLGEPLRLRNQTSPTDIMILHSIIERPHAEKPSRSQIVFVGDTYTLQTTNLSPAVIPQNEVYLPLRVREDLRARNAITITNADPTKRTSFWKLQAKSVKMGIADIKGRWYESTIFGPIMDAAGYENNRKMGEIIDAGLWMNGQGDCNRPPGGPLRSFKPADVKIRKREEAFGRSIPPNVSFNMSAEDAKRTGVDATKDLRTEHKTIPVSQLRTQESVPQNSAQHGVAQTAANSTHQAYVIDGGRASPYVAGSQIPDGSFDQYMKFDDIDDDTGLSGFGQQYSSQDLESGFFQHDAMQQ